MKFLIILCTFYATIIRHGFASTPSWQKHLSTSALEASLYGDLPPTVFAPDGRLFSVERVAQSISDPDNNLVLAVHCRDGIVVLSTFTQSPYLPRYNHTLPAKQHLLLPHDTGLANPPPRFYRLAPQIWAITAGHTVDSIVLARMMQFYAQAIRREHAPVATLARRLADALQAKTQQTGKGKVLAATGILVSHDSIWRVDPTGQFWRCRAAVAGGNAHKAEQRLIDKIREQEGITEQKQAMILSAIAEWTTEHTMDILREIVRDMPRKNEEETWRWHSMVLRPDGTIEWYDHAQIKQR